MTYCTCTPGSDINGWFENRCQNCLDEEKQIWADMLDRLYNGDFDYIFKD